MSLKNDFIKFIRSLEHIVFNVACNALSGYKIFITLLFLLQIYFQNA